MKITGMSAKDFMGLEATSIEIKQSAGAIEIHGNNEQGKSRFLDIIGATVGGAKYTKHIKEAISEGKKRASVSITTDDGYEIIREWTPKKSTLHVTHEDDGVMSKPSRWLETIIGEISFDPMAFVTKQPKDQKAYLMELAGLNKPLGELDKRRREVNDDKASLKAKFEAESAVYERMVDPAEEHIVNPQKPEHIDVSEKAEKVSEAEESKAEFESMLIDAESNKRHAEDSIEELKAMLNKAQSDLESANGNIRTINKSLSELPDITELKAEVEKAQRNNEAVKLRKEKIQQSLLVIDAQDQLEGISDRLSEIEDERLDLLKNAKYPVKGLGFDEDGVTFEDMPFSQCAQSRRLRVSMLIAMANNPEFRVIRVNDAALLDEDSIKEVDEFEK